MSILIVGSSSCLSEAVSKSLTQRKTELIGTYHHNKPKNPERYLKLIRVDFAKTNEIKKLSQILPLVSDIIFTIGRVNYLEENKSKINYLALKNITDYLKSKNIQIRIIFCSSSAVYGSNKTQTINELSDKKPINIYGRHKLLAEKILIKSGLEYVIVRFPMVFGHNFRQKFVRLKSAARGGLLNIIDSGLNNIPFIHELDLTLAIEKIIRNKKVIRDDFVLASGYVKQNKLINQICNSIGANKPGHVTKASITKIAQK